MAFSCKNTIFMVKEKEIEIDMIIWYVLSITFDGYKLPS